MKNDVVFNRTKIVATIGPASRRKDIMTELAKAGVNVFRLNFSHGSHEDHQITMGFIDEINKELGTNCCALQDLQGPKIRTNLIEDGEVQIFPGQRMVITTGEDVGTSEIISTTYKSLTADVKMGDKILIDDGKLELKVTDTQNGNVVTQVVHGGPLKSRKGINLPNTNVSAPSLTEKDIEDLEFGLSQDVDWVALSFVRDAADIIDLRQRIKAAGKDTRIVAKIEKPEAIANIDAIIAETDAIMVARGDLGVEIPSEQVPIEQKKIIQKCNVAGKPVIVATQMMESMIDNPIPTRAETNDVANAVLDGADAVMLSAESASGKYPIQAVRSMSSILSTIEMAADTIYNRELKKDVNSKPVELNDELIAGAVRLGDSINSKALVGITKTGYTAFKVSSFRPKSDIFVFTDNKKLLRMMSLIWGVRGFYYPGQEAMDGMLEHIEESLREERLLEIGDVYINLAPMPFHQSDVHTNMMKVNVVE